MATGRIEGASNPPWRARQHGVGDAIPRPLHAAGQRKSQICGHLDLSGAELAAAGGDGQVDPQPVEMHLDVLSSVRSANPLV